jgi:hypothetical protein
VTSFDQFIMTGLRKQAEDPNSVEGVAAAHVAETDPGGSLDLSDLSDDELMEIQAALQEEGEDDDLAVEKIAEFIGAQAEFFGECQAEAFYRRLGELSRADRDGHLKEAMEKSEPSSLFLESLRAIIPHL